MEARPTKGDSSPDHTPSISSTTRYLRGTARSDRRHRPKTNRLAAALRGSGTAIVIRRPRWRWRRGLTRPADPCWYQVHRRTAAIRSHPHNRLRPRYCANRPPPTCEEATVDRDPQAAAARGGCRRVRGFFADGSVAARATWAHSSGRSGLVSRHAKPRTYPVLLGSSARLNPDDISLHVNACALIG